MNDEYSILHYLAIFIKPVMISCYFIIKIEVMQSTIRIYLQYVIYNFPIRVAVLKVAERWTVIRIRTRAHMKEKLLRSDL